MAGLFDSIGHLFGGAAVPGSAAQKFAMMGSPLIQALLQKHGAAGVPEAGAAGGAEPGLASNQGVSEPGLGSNGFGPNVGSQSGRTANVVGNLASFGGGEAAPAGSPFDTLDTGVNPGALGGDAMGGIKDALSANAAHPRGFLDRIGDFIHSDEGRAALLRSGAATLQGGLGAGIQAGANFVDQRHAERSAADMAERKFGLQERELDDNRDWRMGQLDTTRDQNHETAEHYRRGDANQEYGIRSENWRAGLHEKGENYRTGVHESGENYRTGARVSEDHFEHVTPSGTTVYSQDAETGRNNADNHTSILNSLRQNAPTNTVHAHYTTTPERFAREGPRLRPSEVKPADTGAKQISTDAEYNALPSGARFTGPDGQVRIKP